MRRMALVRAASSAPRSRPSTNGLASLRMSTGRLAQVGEGGVAGAEVVDGQVDAEGAEAAEALQHGLLVGHEHALGDLQHQLARVQPGGVEGAGHVLEQVGLLELAHRQVDAEERVGLEREPALPVAGGLAGGVQHPAADGHDQAGVLGQGDELARHDQAPVGMVPADQRLQPGQAAAAELDHRLVADGELLADDGPAQRRLEVEPLHGPGVHGRVEHPDPGPAGRLGRVHGHVGVAQQPLGVLVAAAGHADPDAGPGQHLAAGHGDRGAQDGRQPLAQGDRLGLVADLGDEHGELVAAEPGRQVVRLQAAPQPLGHHPQDLVAGGVAEAVVDGLEVVQVQQQQGRPGIGRACPGRPAPPAAAGRTRSGWPAR